MEGNSGNANSGLERCLKFLLRFGLILLFGGIGWFIAWAYPNRNAPEWLQSELRPPWPARLMVSLGLLTFASAAIALLIKSLSARLHR